MPNALPRNDHLPLMQVFHKKNLRLRTEVGEWVGAVNVPRVMRDPADIDFRDARAILHKRHFGMNINDHNSAV